MIRKITENRSVRRPHLFVVQPGGEGEDAGLRVEGEDIVAPVGDDRVGHLPVGAFVSIPRRHLAHL